MAHKSLKIFWIVLIAAVLAAFCAVQTPYAQDLPESCDSNFNDVMHARARIEAMREMEVAQALILKPDSVLEYSCFDDRLNELGVSMNMMFSGNIYNRYLFSIPPQQWDADEDSAIRIMPDGITAPNTGQEILLPGPNPPGGPLSGHGYVALGQLVYNAMFEFLAMNFSHVYAGGTYSEIPAGTMCNPMEVVWKFLKCQNFNQDLFINFDDIAGNDPRSLIVNPTQMPPCANADRIALWEALVAAAFPQANAMGGVESVVTYLPLLDSSQCSSVKPIMTGVKVYKTVNEKTETFDDGVCLPAGCTYDGAGQCL